MLTYLTQKSTVIIYYTTTPPKEEEMSLYDIQKISECLLKENRKIDILLLESVSSTNDYAKKLVFDDEKGTNYLVLAREQTEGKGQYDRKFYSPLDSGIYMSLALHPEEIKAEELSFITLMCGVCVRDAIKNVCGLDCKLKYVNDVIYDGKKLCGILTEAVFEENVCKGVVMGIGINVKKCDYPIDILGKVCSIEENIRNDVDVNKLIAEIVNNICFKIKNFDVDGIKRTYFEHVLELHETNLVE